MKKLLLVFAGAALLTVLGCPKEEEAPAKVEPVAAQPAQPESAPAPAVVEEAPKTEAEKAAFAEITADNAGEKAKALEAELNKDIEAAGKLGAAE